MTDGQRAYTSPIVSLGSPFAAAEVAAGGVGVMHQKEGAKAFDSFEVRMSPRLVKDEHLERKLYDAQGVYRGEMSGSPEWENFGKSKLILLDAYRPERFPYSRDWVLVLEKRK